MKSYLIILLSFLYACSHKVNKIKPVTVEQNETLHSEYFNVHINKITSTDYVFIDFYNRLYKEDGNKYIILNISYTNTDSISHIISNIGELAVYWGQNKTLYDPMNITGFSNFGIPLESHNPGTVFTTNIIYKVPFYLAGKGYYIADTLLNAICLGYLEEGLDRPSFLKSQPKERLNYIVPWREHSWTIQ